MRIDLREKTVDMQIQTSYHSFYFGHSEHPKELDLFNVSDKQLQTMVIGKTKVHKGFYRAMKDFIKNYKRLAVELTKDEEALLKEFEPETYELYIKYHKGRFDEEKILDEPEPKKEVKKTKKK